LYTFLVAILGGANEVVVGEPHPLPQRAELAGNLVGKLLWSFARSLGGALDLLPMFVGAGEEIRVLPQHALPTRHRVTSNRRIGMTDVRPRIHVVNRGRDVKLLAHGFSKSINHEGHEVTQRITGVFPSCPFVSLVVSAFGLDAKAYAECSLCDLRAFLGELCA